VGIGFSLEIGDGVQAIYDYVDLCWRTVLAGGTVLLLMKLILQIIFLVRHWFLFTALLFGLVLFALNWVFKEQNKAHKYSRDALLFVSVLCVTLYVILPVCVASASYLSQKITEPLIDEAQEGFSKLEKDMTPEVMHDKFFPEQDKKDESFLSKLDFSAKIAQSKTVLRKITVWIKKTTKDFAIWTIKLISAYIFDCIVFPYAFLIVAYGLTKGLLVYVFGKSQSTTMKEDMEKVIKKYFLKKGDVKTETPSLPAPPEGEHAAE